MSASDKPFDGIVPVAIRSGLTLNVTSTRQAADVLLNKWPASADTRKHLAARRACLEVLQGLAETRKAKRAFAAAAKEAGILRER